MIRCAASAEVRTGPAESALRPFPSAMTDGLCRCQAEEDGGSPERKAGSSIQKKKLDRMRQKLKKVWHSLKELTGSTCIRTHPHTRSLRAQSPRLYDRSMVTQVTRDS